MDLQGPHAKVSDREEQRIPFSPLAVLVAPNVDDPLIDSL